jgi:hypothetical protein
MMLVYREQIFIYIIPTFNIPSEIQIWEKIIRVNFLFQDYQLSVLIWKIQKCQINISLQID